MPLTQITEQDLRKVLDYHELMTAIEIAMLNVTEGRAIQTPRSFTKVPFTDNMLLTMPGYLNADDFKSLACKVVSVFPNNTKIGKPAIAATILLFNEETGALDAILDGTEVTKWRTASASLVATKVICGADCENKILAIIGAGNQGKIHAEAFQATFNFKKVHVWNKTYSKALELCEENDKKGNNSYKPFECISECVADADVIVTTTFSTTPLIKYKWLKKGVHINAIGVCENIMELDEETYKASAIFVDHKEGAKAELQHLIKLGITFEREVGELLNGTIAPPAAPEVTVFQSLGMAVEDCAVAKMLYKKYKELQFMGDCDPKEDI